MSDEHDSWFKSAFGVDLGESFNKITAVAEQVRKTATQVVASVQALPGAAGGEGTGSFPLGGSVGRGGKNALNDVRAVQAALGIVADGQCGPQTIAAIEACQRKAGQSKPDGRVDAGGATERALAGGAEPLVTSNQGSGQESPAEPDSENSLVPVIADESEVEGDLVDALLEQQTALLTSLQNAGSDAEREQIEEELEGVGSDISSELWTLKAAEATREAGSPEALARAEEFRQLNPQLEQRYATASGNFTQRQLDAQRISRGINAARMGVAAAGTLWATDDVGLAELVGAVTGAAGSLAKPLAPVTGRSAPPSGSPARGSDPSGAPVDPSYPSQATMLASATKPGKGKGTSPIGTAIQSHAKRPAKAFASAGGNSAKNTEIGRKFLVDLFSDSQTTVTRRIHKKLGEIIDVRRPDGTGAAFTPEGDFINLLEPYTPPPASE